MRHDTFVYGSDDEYVDALVPLLLDGLEAGEPVSVTTTPHNSSLLREALGASASGVRFTDSTAFYETPARAIAGVYQAQQQQRLPTEAARALTVGEAEFGTTTAEHLDWLRYEAIVNAVFRSAPAWFICTYDHRRLPEWVIDMAACTHPYMITDGRRIASDRFGDPAELARELAPPPPAADGEPVLEMWVDRHGLPAARQALCRLARQASSSPDHANELTIGLIEVVTNAVVHGSERAYVGCWLDEDRLVCDVIDEGPGLDDPFAGFRPPVPDQLDGRGLWLARQTLDSVELQLRADAGLHARVAAGRS